MGSRGGTSRTSNYPVVKKLDLVSLRKCADRLGPIERGSFNLAYGNILMLLQLEVQPEAIAALSQFYDSATRCFLFRNFQMAPTLEEYTQILGFPQHDIRPYQYEGNYYSDDKLSSLLQVSKEDLQERKQNRNQVIGFPQEYFESQMNSLAEAKNWGLFKRVLALTIFGIVLFPRLEKYVDTTAIGIFLHFKNDESSVNPVPAILADTYCTFTHYGELRARKICCSLHVLYAWLLTHTFDNKGQANNPLEYAKGCVVKTMNTLEWLQLLGDLTEYKVRWFTPSCWKDRPRVIFRCGSFQNVPLMGTRGCINYNPSLLLRQLGYPMRNPPTDDMLFRFYFHEKSTRDEDMLRRISLSWDKIDRRGKEELSKRSGDNVSTFSQWLQKTIQNTRLPYQSALRVEEAVCEPNIPIAEELEELRIAISTSEKEKKDLREELERALLRNQKLEEESALKSMAIEDSNKRLKLEEKSKQEVQKYLKGAKEELKRCNLKMNTAIEDAQEWKRLWEESTMAERTTRSALVKTKRESRILVAELEDQVRGIKQDRETVEGILKEYQEALKKEQERSDEMRSHIRYLEEVSHSLRSESKYWESRFMELIGRIENHEVFTELKNESQYWKDKFSKLAWLANQAIIDIPKRLKQADAVMHPFNTPVEVSEFMDFCKVLIEELKEKAFEHAASRKRKRDEEEKTICI